MYALIDERIVLVRLLEYWKNVEDCLVPLLLRNSRKNWERRNVKHADYNRSYSKRESELRSITIRNTSYWMRANFLNR